KFDDSHAASWTGTLSIYNYALGNDHLFFGIVDHAFDGIDGGLTNTQLTQISFFTGLGTGFLGSASFLSSGVGEVVPVPEPSMFAVAISLLGFAGWRERQRRTSSRG